MRIKEIKQKKISKKTRTKIKLAIADDSEKFRKAIIRLIHLENDLEVILEAENGIDLLKQLEIETPDIILMDVRMPIMNGIETTDKIRWIYPHLKIIAYSQYDIEENIIQMNIHGVKSFIGKEDDPEELFKAIRIVHGGGVYMTSKAAEIVHGYLKKSFMNSRCSFELNEMEITFLKCICQGLSSTDIGKLIHKSHRTVEKNRETLYQKLNVRNKEQLIVLASRWFSDLDFKKK